MSSNYKFPIELFREISLPESASRMVSPENLVGVYFKFATSEHWSACLIRQKIRYQIKTIEILKRALQKKDFHTIQKWYVAGLHKNSKFFSGSELDLMERIVNSTPSTCINPLLDFERGLIID